MENQTLIYNKLELLHKRIATWNYFLRRAGIAVFYRYPFRRIFPLAEAQRPYGLVLSLHPGGTLPLIALYTLPDFQTFQTPKRN